MTEYERWLSVELDDPDLKEELLSVKDQPEEINDRFYRDLAFGTGGLSSSSIGFLVPLYASNILWRNVGACTSNATVR